MDDQQFQQLTANLTNLVELTLYGCSDDVENLNANAIVKFLRSHYKVKQLNVIGFSEQHQVELEEQMKVEWHTEINGNRLYFERNQNTK